MRIHDVPVPELRPVAAEPVVQEEQQAEERGPEHQQDEQQVQAEGDEQQPVQPVRRQRHQEKEIGPLGHGCCSLEAEGAGRGPGLAEA